MKRKTLYFPPDLVSKLQALADQRNVSFASVVRDAAYSYNPDSDNVIEEEFLDVYRESVATTVEKIDRLCARLDETHETIEEANQKRSP